MKARIQELKEVNIALSKRRRAKRSYIRLGGLLSIKDVTDILVQKDIQTLLEKELEPEGSRTKRRAGGPRHCSNCGQTGHNSRTYQEDAEMDEEPDSE